MTPNDPERTWSIVRVRHGCSRAKPMSIERFEPSSSVAPDASVRGSGPSDRRPQHMVVE